MDEDKGNKDGETILDRIAAIPFQEWEDIPAAEFANKQRKYKQVVDSPEAPTTLVIGEIGDFIRSEEFGEKRIEFANMLYEFADESIKMRTLMSSYGSFYAILWKLHQIFETVWLEMGFTWTGLLDWAEKVWTLPEKAAPRKRSLKELHQEVYWRLAHLHGGLEHPREEKDPEDLRDIQDEEWAEILSCISCKSKICRHQGVRWGQSQRPKSPH